MMQAHRHGAAGDAVHPGQRVVIELVEHVVDACDEVPVPFRREPGMAIQHAGSKSAGSGHCMARQVCPGWRGKSQVQVLDRAQPGLPLERERASTMTHDYKRNGTTTLFAALNVLDGQVIARCRQRHSIPSGLSSCARLIARRQGKTLHLVCDNYGQGEPKKVSASLQPPLPGST